MCGVEDSWLFAKGKTARGKCTSMSCSCSHHSLLLLPLLVQDNVPEWPCKAGNECFRRDRWE